jgi:hypothetical protein
VAIILGVFKQDVDIATAPKSASVLSYKQLLDVEVFYASSKVYTVTMLCGLVEPTLLRFLPWYKTPFSNASGYPDAATMRFILTTKAVQLIVVFVGQILLLYKERDTTSKDFLALLLLNVTFSTIALVISVSEAVMKQGLLYGSTHSDVPVHLTRTGGAASANVSPWKANHRDANGGSIGIGNDNIPGHDDIEMQPVSTAVFNPVYDTKGTGIGDSEETTTLLHEIRADLMRIKSENRVMNDRIGELKSENRAMKDENRAMKDENRVMNDRVGELAELIQYRET